MCCKAEYCRAGAGMKRSFGALSFVGGK